MVEQTGHVAVHVEVIFVLTMPKIAALLEMNLKRTVRLTAVKAPRLTAYSDACCEYTDELIRRVGGLLHDLRH